MAKVEITLTPWKGSNAVPFGEHQMLALVDEVVIDGEPVPATRVHFDIDGLVAVGIVDPSPTTRGRYGPSEILQDTDSRVLWLPVTEFVVD